MGTIVAEEILTVDDSSGVLHRRWRIPGTNGLVGFEADNLDQAGTYTVVEDVHDPRVTGGLCQRCFPTRNTEPTDG
jgi:hypothetical protein